MARKYERVLSPVKIGKLETQKDAFIMSTYLRRSL